MKHEWNCARVTCVRWGSRITLTDISQFVLAQVGVRVDSRVFNAPTMPEEMGMAFSVVVMIERLAYSLPGRHRVPTAARR